jgi:uracil-DNA glycosylase
VKLVTSKIAIVGEAWGTEELKARAPFVGTSGRFLTRMLCDAGIDRASCLLTNVFNLHPPGDDLGEFLGPESEGIAGYSAIGKLAKRKRAGRTHVRAEFLSEIERLGSELIEADPNVVIALGNVALWALLGKVGISNYRGFTALSTHTATGFKILPTYHPMGVLHQISLRPIAVLDLIKAERQSHYPDLRRPKREIWIEPTIEDLHAFRRHINGFVSVDIETSGSHITCVGFAPTPGLGLVIPFHDSRRKGRSYWPTLADERSAWRYVREICEEPKIKKVFQNGLYDIAFLYRAMHIRTRGAEHDTMLLHHALQPEALKSLGFLGSIYTDEGAWKQVRGRTPTIKRDE